ncbi:MAG: DUF4398 domain-containing protein [Acidobacteriota bacterium]
MFPGQRRLAFACFLVVLTLAAGCGDDPPQIEIQQAQSAIEAARTAGADEYAHDELAAAESALVRARTAVDERDYRLALNNSLDSRERAQTASAEAASEKAAARAEAERALGGAAATLADVQARLKVAQAGGVPAAKLAAARRGIAAGDQALQKARAAFNQGRFRAVPPTLTAPIASLAVISRDLEGPPRQAPRRPR